ncbi:restriction endonuclease [Streptomyces sp. NPDC005231]|uniref:restriction endonuclease n=1 Tax=Streptomyces sp. NPDC005231 TaxID=3157026 RepID=UPI0033B1C9A6
MGRLREGAQPVGEGDGHAVGQRLHTVGQYEGAGVLALGGGGPPGDVRPGAVWGGGRRDRQRPEQCWREERFTPACFYRVPGQVPRLEQGPGAPAAAHGVLPDPVGPEQPVSGRRSSRSRKRQQLRAGEALVLAAVILWVVGRLHWLAGHLWIMTLTLVVAAAGAVLWQHTRIQQVRQHQAIVRSPRYPMTRLDQLHHRDFEHAIRDLMYRDGCTDAAQIGGAGDNGADVKATDPYGRRWVIQCKHRRAGLAVAVDGTPDRSQRHRTPRPQGRRHRPGHQRPLLQTRPGLSPSHSACTSSGLPWLCRPYLIEIDHRARTALASRRNGDSRSGRRTTTDMTGRASGLP